MTTHEFYDLAEHKLNINVQTHSIDTSWGNLGYWKGEGVTYPQACKQLALAVADIAQLSQANNILDTGFGCGDQLHIWAAHKNINTITGMNISNCQTLWAKQKIAEKPLFKNTAIDITTADCCDPAAWKSFSRPFDRIIALDCIYHFNDKPQYFSLCRKHMTTESLLVVSDLLLTDKSLTPFQKVILKIICFLSHIPFNNFKTEHDYRSQLTNEKLELCLLQDISADVFLPFGAWLKAYIPKVKSSQALRKDASFFSLHWLKYKGTAMFLAWGYKKQIFRYCILRIQKP